MRVLILSAPVGAGHDAAAAALAAELADAGVEVTIDDGLALLGFERLLVSTYRFQIIHAGWSWRLMYRCARSRGAIRALGTFLARCAGGRLTARAQDVAPDVVVSAYPIVSAAIAGLRRRGRWPHPTVTLVTDFDPHPGWIHPELEANLVVGFASSECEPIRPPIAAAPPSADARASVRAELGAAETTRVILIVGGAWGVGNLQGAARAAAAAPGTRTIVCAGHNDHLQRTLSRDPELAGATIYGFSHNLPDLMAASDVLIQNAGGLTCLEAFGAGVPVVMFDPLPGHGEDNTLIMAASGLVTVARSADDLRGLLGSPQFWDAAAPLTADRAGALFERPSAAQRIVGLAEQQTPQRTRYWPRRRLIAGAVIAAALLTGNSSLRHLDLAAPPGHQPRQRSLESPAHAIDVHPVHLQIHMPAHRRGGHEPRLPV